MASAGVDIAGTAPSATRPTRTRARRGRRAKVEREIASVESRIDDAVVELQSAERDRRFNNVEHWTTEIAQLRELRADLHDQEYRLLAERLCLTVEQLEEFDDLAARISSEYVRKVGPRPDDLAPKARPYSGNRWKSALQVDRRWGTLR